MGTPVAFAGNVWVLLSTYNRALALQLPMSYALARINGQHATAVACGASLGPLDVTLVTGVIVSHEPIP